MLNYNHLYYFHVTATEGTVANAAKQLGVGQPTVSEQVRQLERALGTSLFERTGGKLRLTEAGRSAFEHTSVMFRAGERLVETLIGDRTPPAVSLRVGISTAVARSVAADFLMPVLAMKECTPTILTGEAHDLLRQLRAHDLDLLLSEIEPGKAGHPGFEVVAIHQPRLVAVTSSDDKPQEGWEDVSLIQYRPTSVFRFPVDNYMDAHGLRPRIAAETDDALVMMAAVTRGGFTAFVPWTIARERVADGSVNVLARLKPDNIAVHAIYHDGAGTSIARRAVEQLVEYAKQDEGD